MNARQALVIDRIDHVSVLVTDVARACAFYRDVLGMPEVPRPESFDFPGAWFEVGRNLIHLLGKPKPDIDSPRHFCIWVADVHRAAEWMKQCRCEVAWDVKSKIPGVDRFFTKDPDGNRIEIQGSDAGK